MPEGLEFNCLNRSEHADYIDGFFEGPLGDILQEENSDLLARCREAEDCVVIQGEIAEDDGRCWIHTRGILEFGRPDLSLYADDESVDEYIQIINQMIFYSGQGVFFDGTYTLHTGSGNTYEVKSLFV